MNRQAFITIRPTAAFGLLSALLSVACLQGQPLSDQALARIDFEQRLSAQVPLDLRFVDETGKPVRLGDYLGSRPVVLVLGYYRCPMLCTMVLNGLVESLEDMRWRAGADFDVVNVSIDPQEQPSLAAAKKQTYVKRYGRSGTEGGWHFLTGRQQEIQLLAQTVGFGYRFDPVTGQYAHPSGLVILTPQGKVAKYFFGVTFAPQALYEALRTASANKTGSPIRRLILLCFHYNPLTGKYSPVVLRLVRVLSAATLLGLGGVVYFSARRPKPS